LSPFVLTTIFSAAVARRRNGAPASQIANPNSKPGTNSQYTVDGRFSDCSSALNSGVAPIVSYVGLA